MVKRVFRSAARSLPLVLAIMLCLTQLAAAASTRISRLYTTDGYVVSQKVSSLGNYAVYKTFKLDETFQGWPNLYSVPLAGGPPVSLTSPLAMNYDANGSLIYEITPAGTHVVFNAYMESANYRYLYVIPIQGGTAVPLSQINESVLSFVISPDSQFVVFNAKGSSDQVHMYRANLNGAPRSAVDITPDGKTNFTADSIKISPNNEHILFYGDFAPDGPWGIYRIPANGDGSVYTRLSLDYATKYVGLTYLITPDSKRVIYQHIFTDAVNVTTHKLYSVPITGPSQPNRPVSIKANQISQFKLSPNGRYLVFLSDGDVKYKFELYSVDLNSRNIPIPVKKLNVPISNDKNVSQDFEISPDSSRVVYKAELTHRNNLFSVPINGPITSNVPINTPVNPTDPLSAVHDSFSFSPDSARIIFTSMHTPDLIELWSVPAAGPAAAAVKLNPPLVKEAVGIDGIYDFAISPDGNFVVFTAPTVANKSVLFQSPIIGPGSKSVPLSPVSVVSAYGFAPNSPELVYTAGETGIRDKELFLTSHAARTYLPAINR